jgi:hypothetical protein
VRGGGCGTGVGYLRLMDGWDGMELRSREAESAEWSILNDLELLEWGSIILALNLALHFGGREGA